MGERFDSFDLLLDEKNPQKFTETYLRAQAIQLLHGGRSIKPIPSSILPLDILVESIITIFSPVFIYP
jgi:hypothetical protein